MTRWVSYTSIDIPGNQSFGLGFHDSIAKAKESFIEFCDSVGESNCSMRLYFVIDDEMLKTAKDFENIGCPFDYPDRILERGPRGGIVVHNT